MEGVIGHAAMPRGDIAGFIMCPEYSHRIRQVPRNGILNWLFAVGRQSLDKLLAPVTRRRRSYGFSDGLIARNAEQGNCNYL
jgi:hypothetical protein